MSQTSDWEQRIMGSDGAVDIDTLTEMLLVTRTDVAISAGTFHLDPASTEAQHRLSAMARILNRVAPWTGHPRIAFAWFRSQPLPSFGHATAEDLLKMDRAGAVEAYLARISAGGFA